MYNIIIIIAVLLFYGSLWLCSFLEHCACAMDYMKQHPLVEAKEDLKETNDCNIYDE